MVNTHNSALHRAPAPTSDLMLIYIIIIGLMLPIILTPLVKIIGYSEVVEEIAKALVVLFLILKLPSANAKIFAGIIFGLLFGLSESILYLNNILQLGDFSIFWQRLLWTVPMHIITVLIITAATLKWRVFLPIGLAVAIFAHLMFNSII